MAISTAKMREIERGLAYDFASSLIECNCCRALDKDGSTIAGEAYDLRTADKEAREHVAEAASYLEWRRLIQRSEDPQIIWILDESEGL